MHLTGKLTMVGFFSMMKVFLMNLCGGGGGGGSGGGEG